MLDKKGKKVLYVFVYGTLKQHQHNNYLLRDSDMVGSAVTTTPFYMRDVGFPHVFIEPTFKDQPSMPIKGEVYAVYDPAIMADLDILEGVKNNHYTREWVTVMVGDKSYKCQMYLTHPSRNPSIEESDKSLVDKNNLIISGDKYEWK